MRVRVSAIPSSLPDRRASRRHRGAAAGIRVTDLTSARPAARMPRRRRGGLMEETDAAAEPGGVPVDRRPQVTARADRIRDLSSLPIWVAPMAGGPSTPALVAAAARAGGFGFLAGGYRNAAALRADMEA